MKKISYCFLFMLVFSVYAEDQETILDEFTPETDESGEIVMGLQPGTYNILINRLPTSRFEKDLTYDLTVEPFCALACRNSLKRFERYSGEYDLKYEQENFEISFSFNINCIYVITFKCFSW